MRIDRNKAWSVSVALIAGGGGAGMHPLAAQRLWTATPEVTIRADKEDLSRVTDLALAKDGRIAVRQPQDHRIMVFDGRGVLIGSVGRAGEGPGEFRSWRGTMAWKEDSLWIFDTANNRITFFGPDLKLAKTIPAPSSLTDAGARRLGFGGFPAIKAITTTQELVGIFSAEGSGQPPSGVPQVPMGQVAILLAFDGRFHRVVGWPPDNIEPCSTALSSNSVYIPFCDARLFDVTSDGSRFVAIQNEVKGATHFRLVAVDGTHGDTLFNRRFVTNPIAIPQRVADSVREAHLAAPSLTPAMRQAYEGLHLYKYYPAFGRLVLGTDRSIWLQVYGFPGACRWRIFDSTGRDLGQVDLPANARLLAANTAAIWASVENSDGLQDVIKYRLSHR